MTHQIWTLDDLIGFTNSDDAEVRFWAVDRLVRHHPAECCDAIAEHLFDDHEATPPTVARHLGEHGATRHHAVLVKGTKLLRGMTPAHCLQALARLGYAGFVELAADAVKRGDLTEPALALILESLGELGTPASSELARQVLDRKVELLAEPAALRGMLRIVRTEEIPELLTRYLGAVQSRGAHRAGEAFRTLMDSLRIDDTGWCLRTGPSAHIELRKTIKAVESGYDCDILSSIGEATIRQWSQRFRAGHLGETVRALADWTCAAAAKMSGGAGEEYAARVSAAVGALAGQPLLEEVERLGQHVQQWLLGFHLSAAFAVARGLNPEQALKRARGDLDRLLALATLETAHLTAELPSAIAVVAKDDAAAARQAQDWCLRMLEAQGPFFPKVVALATLGELRAVHFIPEVMDYLSDENSYIYGAAERALSEMGEAILLPANARIEAGTLDPDAAHSLLLLLCDLGTRGAYDLVTRHLDLFMELAGPGTTAEWVTLFGTEELIEPLRDWLDEDPALVGQSLLLLGALHDVDIPEEDEILSAIEEERARQATLGEADEASAGDGNREGGDYVM